MGHIDEEPIFDDAGYRVKPAIGPIGIGDPRWEAAIDDEISVVGDEGLVWGNHAQGGIQLLLREEPCDQ